MAEKQRHSVIPRTLVFIFREGELLLIKYSGNGEHQTKEKEDRKDIYNALGGHIEANEGVIENAIKESREEAGVNLINPRIKGVVHANGFAGKNVMMFVVVAETKDEGLRSTIESNLEWINPSQMETINVFDDMKPILGKVLTLQSGEMFTGISRFDGFKLVSINLQVSKV